MSDKIKLDYLWKRAKGVTNTTPDKAPHNESLPSYDPIFQNQIWVKTETLPKPAPFSVPDPAPGWSDYLKLYTGADALQLVRDLTTRDAKSWAAVKGGTRAITGNNILMDWVPPRLHASYRIKVYAGDPNSNTVNASRLYPDALGYEWEFDYTSGVLVFLNDVPQLVRERGIWIEGWRYTGPKGGGLTRDEIGNGFTGKDFTIQIPQLAPGEHYDFDLDTGGSCTLVSTTVDAAAIVECHSMISRDDTNPYRFVANADHLVDDGSYVVAGRRFYGARFCILQNLFRPQDGVTYWRIYNDDAVLTKSILLTVRAIPRV